MRATAAITVNRPVEDVYRYWRDFENLPTFMFHLESVELLEGNRSRWQAKAPAGTKVSWDAELVEDNPNALIAWCSLEGADVENTGAVTFTAAPAGQGTEITVEVEYRLSGGKLTELVAKLFGEEPAQQIHDDLRRFKQVLETGEVLRSDASPAGPAAGQLVNQEEAHSTPATPSSGSCPRPSAVPIFTSTTATSPPWRRATSSATSSWARWSRWDPASPTCGWAIASSCPSRSPAAPAPAGLPAGALLAL